MKITNEMKLTIESRSINESFARVAVTAFASQLDPTIEEINDIKTAVSEAVTNAIVHAYPDGVGKIRLQGKIFEDHSVEFTVRDYGCGIADIAQARTPLFTTGGEERSGMGFTIMESFTDRMRVKSALGKGTTVVMQKRIAPRLR